LHESKREKRGILRVTSHLHVGFPSSAGERRMRDFNDLPLHSFVPEEL